MILVLLLSMLQIAPTCFNSWPAKMSFATACSIFVSWFLAIAVSIMENLRKLGNNLSGLFISKNCAAAEAAIIYAAEMTFFVVYYGF